MREFTHIEYSLIGLSHAENQDGTLVLEHEEFLLCAVFDGVSRSENPVDAVNLARNHIQNSFPTYQTGSGYRLKDLMTDLHSKIVSSEFKNSLTTCCLALVWREEDRGILISHLGDSRIYTIGRRGLYLHTIDDTWVPGSNIITKCLGMNNLTARDIYQSKLPYSHEFLMLCTDGLYPMFNTDLKDISRMLFSNPLEKCKDLIHEAVHGNNVDDASCVIVGLDRT